MNISIIVPLYHGQKYVENIIAQAEANAADIPDKLELLLINDDPSDPINENWRSDIIQINVVNTDLNRGIYGARVRGLERAKGDFVLFLDQDDRIAPNYIKEQLTVMEDADAVVCEALQNQMKFYHPNRMLEECVDKDYMVQEGNFIISPGQVLIRKTSIPEFWKNNILCNNGADDWFLWICMLCTGKRFRCNQEILFEHVVHTENVSANGVSMLNSMREVYEKLSGNKSCADKDLQGIAKVIQKHENNYLEERDKFLELYFMLDKWMNVWEQGKSVADYICSHGYNKVSIYGKGKIGLRLARELQAKQIEISCFIDKNAKVLTEGIKTILPEEARDISEPVIITLAKKDAKKIKAFLKNRGINQLYHLFDIIEALKK